VQAVLGKCCLRHQQESRRCAPYVYIESSNDASRALFTSLGFRKCNDVVWAGLTLKSNS
jgi:L-amino acid N-acyltransferase YncA